jgi:hypothetical protein
MRQRPMAKEYFRRGNARSHPDCRAIRQLLTWLLMGIADGLFALLVYELSERYL